MEVPPRGRGPGLGSARQIRRPITRHSRKNGEKKRRKPNTRGSPRNTNVPRRGREAAVRRFQTAARRPIRLADARTIRRRPRGPLGAPNGDGPRPDRTPGPSPGVRPDLRAARLHAAEPLADRILGRAIAPDPGVDHRTEKAARPDLPEGPSSPRLKEPSAPEPELSNPRRRRLNLPRSSR